MKYSSAPSFRQALETRLGTVSRAGGPSLVRLRKAVGFDRLLARLVAVAPDRWILKAALALDYRFGDRARTTRDIDLAMTGDEASATADLQAAQAADLNDFFSFAIERTGTLDRLVDGATVRYHVVAELAGRTFDEFVLDIGFDPPAGIEPDRLRGPDLLAVAGIEPVVVPALPLEFGVAEKVHAYSRAYGDRTVASTRVKDLVDLVLIAGEAALDGQRLRAALDATFEAAGLPATSGDRGGAALATPGSLRCCDDRWNPHRNEWHRVVGLRVLPRDPAWSSGRMMVHRRSGISIYRVDVHKQERRWRREHGGSESL